MGAPPGARAHLAAGPLERAADLRARRRRACAPRVPVRGPRRSLDLRLPHLQPRPGRSPSQRSLDPRTVRRRRSRLRCRARLRGRSTGGGDDRSSGPRRRSAPHRLALTRPRCSSLHRRHLLASLSPESQARASTRRVERLRPRFRREGCANEWHPTAEHFRERSVMAKRTTFVTGAVAGAAIGTLILACSSSSTPSTPRRRQQPHSARHHARRERPPYMPVCTPVYRLLHRKAGPTRPRHDSCAPAGQRSTPTGPRIRTASARRRRLSAARRAAPRTQARRRAKTRPPPSADAGAATGDAGAASDDAGAAGTRRPARAARTAPTTAPRCTAPRPTTTTASTT